MPTIGSTTAGRGYDYQHKKLREQVRPMVEAGKALCWRCIENGLSPEEARIKPDEPWDLGHDDDDRSRYRGPEHQRCNRATAGRRAMFSGPPVDTSRAW